jgi:hypothetical protein
VASKARFKKTMSRLKKKVERIKKKVQFKNKKKIKKYQKEKDKKDLEVISSHLEELGEFANLKIFRNEEIVPEKPKPPMVTFNEIVLSEDEIAILSRGTQVHPPRRTTWRRWKRAR